MEKFEEGENCNLANVIVVSITISSRGFSVPGLEKEFELEIRIVIRGYGKQIHWRKLGQRIKALLTSSLHECEVSVDRVRIPGGKWYPCPVGKIEDYDFDHEMG